MGAEVVEEIHSAKAWAGGVFDYGLAGLIALFVAVTQDELAHRLLLAIAMLLGLLRMVVTLQAVDWCRFAKWWRRWFVGG